MRPTSTPATPVQPTGRTNRPTVATFPAAPRHRHRATAVAALLLLLVLALLPAGTAAAAEEGDSAWETALTGLRVKAVLLEKLGTDALGIEVEVDDGEALLTGAVDDRSTQELAEQAALSVDGIRAVDNELRLRREIDDSPGATAQRAARDLGDELADARLEGKVHLRLFGEIGRHAGRLTVEAVDGVVSLRGRLPDKERKKLALRVARETKGVDKVIDLIDVAE